MESLNKFLQPYTYQKCFRYLKTEKQKHGEDPSKNPCRQLGLNDIHSFVIMCFLQGNRNTLCIFFYLIFYFLINIGLNSIKIKLLKLNSLVESSIDCKFKSFKIYQFTITRTGCS
jgi:hypothetical protein